MPKPLCHVNIAVILHNVLHPCLFISNIYHNTPDPGFGQFPYHTVILFGLRSRFNEPGCNGKWNGFEFHPSRSSIDQHVRTELDRKFIARRRTIILIIQRRIIQLTFLGCTRQSSISFVQIFHTPVILFPQLIFQNLFCLVILLSFARTCWSKWMW